MNGCDERDEWLMARVAHGERDCLEPLVRRHATRLLTFIERMAGDCHRAEELFQEVFLAVWVKRRQYQFPRPFKPWLYAIARNIRVDHYRQVQRTENRHQSLEESPDIPQKAETGSAGTPDLEALLATLPESQREVLAMLKVAGMSLEEAARATATSVGSVKQKAHRAYENLRGRLSDMGIRSAGKGGPS